jgi:hypothetical protein
MNDFLDTPCKIGDRTITYTQDVAELIDLADCPIAIAALVSAIKDSLPSDGGVTRRALWDRLSSAQRQKLKFGVSQ